MRRWMNAAAPVRRRSWSGIAAWLVTMLLLVMGSSGESLVQAAPLRSHTAAPTTVQLTGTLLVVWSDPLPGALAHPEAHYTLVNAAGHRTQLLVDAHSTTKLAALTNQQVTVEGELVGPQRVKVTTLAHAATPNLTATAPSAALVQGAQPWVTILCRFSDQPTLTPHPLGWYATLMGATAPGLDHYWREVSYNTINLDGSVVVGWYNLPHPRSYYVDRTNTPNTTELSNDCTAAADADVFFPQFMGVNMIFNNSLGTYHRGGIEQLTWDGVRKNYGATWIADDVGALDQAIVAHEMGHAFGLPHSSGPYAAVYDSQWDVMSGYGTCAPLAPVYRCVGVHTIAYHKDLLGWISAADKYVANAPGTHQFTLAPLAAPAAGSAYLMAQVPINGSFTRFYTLEARRKIGYDRGIPNEGVVIHRVDTLQGDIPAHVVDPDTNGNPNDAGALWLPGETFRDPANGITITIEQAMTTGFAVTITTTTAACPDTTYEPDNEPDQGRAFTVGTTEQHAFCDAFDVDRVFFDARAGTTYRIETRNLAAGTDTFLQVTGDGTLHTDNNSNGGKASVIVLTAGQDGRYDVHVSQLDGAGSAAFTYDLRITAGPASTLRTQQFIPMVQ